MSAIWTDIFEDNSLRNIDKPAEVPSRLLHDEQLVIRDFSLFEFDKSKLILRPYTIDNKHGFGMWGIEDSHKVSINPCLIGEYAIFISVNRPTYGGEIKIKLSKDKFWTPINLQKREVVCPNPEKDKPCYFGENEIEVEFYIKIANMDNEKIEILLEEGSCVTALRFVPINDEQLADYTADMTDQKTKKIIINFETYNDMIPYMEERFERWALSDVCAVHMEFGVSTGYVVYPDSAYMEAWGENISNDLLPYLKPSYRRLIKTFRNLLKQNITPFDIAITSAKKVGIKIIASMRMDLFWGDGKEPDKWRKDSLDDYPLMFHGDFYTENPNLRIPGRNQLDYYNPEVREHFLNVFCEVAEKFDIDGMAMDFTRWPPFIREEADLDIMLDFINEMRTRLDKIGKRKEKRLALCAEFVDGMYSRLTLKEQRIDIVELIKSQILDYIVIESVQIPIYDVYKTKTEYTIKDYIDMGKKYGTPVYPRNDNCFDSRLPKEICGSVIQCTYSDFGHDPYWGDELDDDPMASIAPKCGPLHYQMGVLKYYDMGAERVLLSNCWQADSGLRRLGHIDELCKLNSKNKVFGQKEGNAILWDERIETKIALVEPLNFCNGVAKGILRLTISNTGKLNSKGKAILTIRPKETLKEQEIIYNLEPGETLTKDFKITVFQIGFHAKVNSEMISFESSDLKYIPESWPMKLIEEQISLEQVEKSLIDMKYQDLNWYKQKVAKIKMGQTNENIILFAKVYEQKSDSQYSTLNFYIIGQNDNIECMSFTPNNKEELYSNIEKTDYGYSVEAIIPKKEKGSFEVEFIVEGNAVDFGVWNVSLFGSQNKRTKQSMKIVIIE